MRKFLSTAMILVSATCLANEAIQDEWDNEVIGEIVANENTCVDHYEDTKIYINPDRIHPTKNGIYLNLKNEEFIFIRTIQSDAQGCFIPCYNMDLENTCPGCGLKYYMGGCDNSRCERFQQQQQRKRDMEKEKEDRIEQKKQEKERRKEEKKKKH